MHAFFSLTFNFVVVNACDSSKCLLPEQSGIYVSIDHCYAQEMRWQRWGPQPTSGPPSKVPPCVCGTSGTLPRQKFVSGHDALLLTFVLDLRGAGPVCSLPAHAQKLHERFKRAFGLKWGSRSRKAEIFWSPAALRAQPSSHRPESATELLRSGPFGPLN